MAADPLSDLIEISAGLAAALRDIAAQRPDLPSAAPPGPSDATGDVELASLLVQILLIGAGRTLRY
jgi:hypothetical protein